MKNQRLSFTNFLLQNIENWGSTGTH